MGASSSIISSLQKALEKKDLKLSRRLLTRFAEDVDRIAPWYAVSGSLTVSSWAKLGRDLERARKEGKILPTMLGVWQLISSCLEEGDCTGDLKEAQVALSDRQDSMSESERSQRTGARKKREDASKNIGLSQGHGPSEKKRGGKHAPGERLPAKSTRTAGKSGEKISLYPTSELAALNFDGSGESSSEDTLSGSEEESLEEEVAKNEERYHPDRPTLNKGSPSAPPPYSCEPHKLSLLPAGVRRKMALAFPVFETDAGGRVHAPVEYSQIKELAKATREYGPNASLTLSLLDRFGNMPLTPVDWQSIVRASLPNMGQYLEWKALWSEFSQAQARANVTALTPEQQHWSFEMLTGQGPYAHDQSNFPWGVYTQVAACAIRAWKALPKKGDDTRGLTKIVQGPNEPFSDFVARMTEAAERIFGDSGQMQLVLKQLVFEQATPECRAVIAPRRHKDLDDWIRACRDLGGPLTNAGLAAAILQGQKGMSFKQGKVCYNCNKPGHLRRECKARLQKREPGLCPRCKKGRHWAKDCRSMSDIQGNPLPQEIPVAKNGYSGPRTQGPKRYGSQKAIQKQTLGEQQQGQGEWTSVPPPRSF